MARACAGWIASVRTLETKALLARIAWESSLSADAARARVLELRFPSRLIEPGADETLIGFFEAASRAPSVMAFLLGLRDTFLAGLREAEVAYLDSSDPVADNPSSRFLQLAVSEKNRQLTELNEAIVHERELRGPTPSDDAWTREAALLRDRFGSFHSPSPVKGRRVANIGTRYELPSSPARDDTYFHCSFYWPDIIDPGYGYGSGLTLQVRTAVSHINEVWAVETAGAALFELSDELGHDFFRDAARWTWDEARHMLMGKRRFDAWQFEPADVPLGDYIYQACSKGADPIYRIAMLGYFETKNIAKKHARVQEFDALGDPLSEHDMEFDWADETIHAEYGRRWLKQLLVQRGRPAEAYAHVLTECERLVAARVAEATADELASIQECADRLIAKATARAAAMAAL